MVLTVGFALFSFPSLKTPLMTRGWSRSRVNMLSPRVAR